MSRSMKGITMNRRGFSVVEVLIVIVVIAILAAIVLVTYNGIQDRARLNVAQADMRSGGPNAEVLKVQNPRRPGAADEI